MSEANSTVEYRECVGFPGYRVGDDGSVWSCWGSGRRPQLTDQWVRMNPSRNPDDHLSVCIRRADGRRMKRYVHQLVAAAFIGPCPDGLECCHFPDRDPSNNRPGNLRYDTRRNNLADRYVHGTMNWGERQGHAKLTEDIVRDMRVEYAAGGVSYRNLADKHGIDFNTAYCAVKRKTWRHVS